MAWVKGLRQLQLVYGKDLTSRCITHFYEQHIRLSSTSSFNINDIVKLNESRSKPRATKSKVKTTKKTTLNEEKCDITDTKDDEQRNSSAEHYLTFILDIPMISNVDIDPVKYSKFKECIETLDPKYLPSVGSILKKTQSKSQVKVLERWQKQKVKELGGQEQFDAYKKDMFETGQDFHTCIELQLQGRTDFTVLSKFAGHWDSIQDALGTVNDIKLLETEVVHSDVFYAGRLDCIARIRDTVCLIEWKTSSKPKPLLSATYDNPLQVAAYIGAVNRSGLLKQLHMEDVTKGALVIAYADGTPATVHMMDERTCQKYWQLWLDRLYMYWSNQLNPGLTDAAS